MTQIFETAIANVQSAYPSIYSKEDVVRLIQDLGIAVKREQTNRPGISQEEVNMAIEQVKEELICHIREIDFSNYVELELNHNEIEVNFDERGISLAVGVAYDMATADYITEK